MQVLLHPPRAELLSRLELRAAQGRHFMPPSLLDSQLKQLSYHRDEMYMVFDGRSGGCSSRHNGGNSKSCVGREAGPIVEAICKKAGL